MRALLVAILLKVASPASAAKADCPAAYKNFEPEWAITRAEWGADCASGKKPEDILRRRQQDFMTACADFYRPRLAKAKLEEWNLQVYCAQGATGEAKLSSMTGAPLRRPTEASIAAEAAAAAAAAVAAMPPNPAKGYYHSVDTLGSEWPKGWNDLPGGMLNNSMLRVFSGASHTMYVNLAMNPPRCVMAANNGLHIDTICAPGLPRIMMVVDVGCTGLVKTMTITDEKKRALKCPQAKIDHIYALLDAAYTEGRAKIGK